MEILLIFPLGLVLGSFLTVLANRLPLGEDVLMSRSHCDYCKKILRWWELIPIVSFLIQMGRCRKCRKSLSLEYPFVELVTGCGLVMLSTTIGFSSILLLISSWAIFASLLVITIADWKYEIIPDSMVVVLILSSLGLGRHDVQTALGAALFFFLLWLGTKGQGMGFGDVKLAFALGFFLGYPLTVVALYTAFLTGALCGVILILCGKKGLKSHISFGPFLILGIGVASVWGDQLLRIWNQIL